MQCQFIRRMPEIQSNLLTLYQERTLQDTLDGLRWYPDANYIVREWAVTYGLSVETVACIVAAISPQCSWDRNLIIADDILNRRPASVGGALHANLAKAECIRNDRAKIMLPYFPHGPKVNTFAANLAGNYTIATVDTHGLQAALNDVQATYTLRWTPYQVFSQCYVNVAHTVGLLPAYFQAIIWHVWKRRYPWERKQQLRKQWHVIGMEG